MVEDLEKRNWWTYIHEDLQELLKESVLLCDRVSTWDEKFHDYSFIVFPAAKAYEGFLKKMFLDLGFITMEDYSGKRFRVGKALNPELERGLRESEGVYDKIVEYCGGVALADRLWETWKICRNLIFHWFPNERNAITLEEAKERVEDVITSIDMAFEGCKINQK